MRLTIRMIELPTPDASLPAKTGREERASWRWDLAVLAKGRLAIAHLIDTLKLYLTSGFNEIACQTLTNTP